MSLSRSKPLKANRDHGPPVEVPTMGVPVCERCGRPYRWSQTTGRRDRPPYGPCSGLKRSELERTSRLSPVSRGNSDHPNDDDAFRGWVRERPCVVCGSPSPNDPHHLRSRGAGHGDFLDDGSGNLVSLCRSCHDEYHSQGRETFADERGIDLAGEARRLGERWRGRDD